MIEGLSQDGATAAPVVAFTGRRGREVRRAKWGAGCIKFIHGAVCISLFAGCSSGPQVKPVPGGTSGVGRLCGLQAIATYFEKQKSWPVDSESMVAAGVLPYECRVPVGAQPVTMTSKSLRIIAITSKTPGKVIIEYSVDQRKFVQEDSTESVLSALWGRAK